MKGTRPLVFLTIAVLAVSLLATTPAAANPCSEDSDVTVVETGPGDAIGEDFSQENNIAISQSGFSFSGNINQHAIISQSNVQTIECEG